MRNIFKDYKYSEYFLGKNVIFFGGPATFSSASSTKQQILNHNIFIRVLLMICMTALVIIVGYTVITFMRLTWAIIFTNKVATNLPERAIAIPSFLIALFLANYTYKLLPPTLFIYNAVFKNGR